MQRLRADVVTPISEGGFLLPDKELYGVTLGLEFWFEPWPCHFLAVCRG